MSVVAKLTREHIDYVVEHIRPIDAREIEATMFDGVPLADHVDVNSGAGYTVFDRDGNPAAIGGIGMVSPGVAQAWMFGTPRLPEARIALTRQTRRLIRATFDSGQAHRVQALSASFHHEAHRWLRRLGFSVEQRLGWYGQNREDFLMFVQFQDWSDGRQPTIVEQPIRGEVDRCQVDAIQM